MAGSGDDLLYGNNGYNVAAADGDDLLYGQDGDDELHGDGGDDYLDPGSGLNYLDGGDGADTVAYISSYAGIIADLVNGTISAGSYATDTILNVENVAGSNQVDTITGNFEANTISGFGGDDTLDGGDGDDIASFLGQRENYTLTYISDSEIIIEDRRSQQQIEDDQTHSVYEVSDTIDTLYNFEYFQFLGVVYNLAELLQGPTEAADVRMGDDLANTFNGFGGDDVLYGLGGDDILNGGDGDDWIDGGSGSNIISGGDGVDMVSYAFYSGNLDANLATGVIGFPGNSTSVDQLDTIENFIAGGGDDVIRGNFVANSLSGSDGDDRLYGEAGEDRMTGGRGDDRLYGGDDNDRLSGGSGEDRLYGEAGDDRLAGAAGMDRLYGSDGNDRMFGNSGDDRLSGGDGDDWVAGGTGSDRLFGSDGDDFLYGETSNDILSGGDGNDLLVGGPGTDQLTGGRGRDVFFFASEADVGPLASRDVILGFTSRWDIIDISDIDANTRRGGNQGFTYIAWDDFSNRAGELRLSKGVLLADTDGNGYSDFQIEVEGRIRSSDLLL